jgi:hypothetical protein
VVTPDEQVAARHPDIPQDPLPGLPPEQRIRADIAADLRERARQVLAQAIAHKGRPLWHARMHRALIRQAWNVQDLPVRGVVPGRPLSYRVEQ